MAGKKLKRVKGKHYHLPYNIEAVGGKRMKVSGKKTKI